MKATRRETLAALGTKAFVAILFLGFFAQGLLAQSAATRFETGLVASYTSVASAARVVRDVVDATQVRCYVASGQSATPFLTPGKFDVVWRGYLSVDLRSEYQFQADVSGDFKLLINGGTVLEFKSDGGASPLSKPVRLQKGTNEFVAVLTSADKGDTFVRLHWTDSETAIRPIPSAAFSRLAGLASLERGKQLRLGRQLFLDHRCGKCHTVPELAQLPEGSMDAPTLEGIGTRRGQAWMAQWILDPKALRPSAHMPKLLLSALATNDAAAIASYLASLKGNETNAVESFSDEQQEAGTRLFQTLLCSGCHTAPTEPAGADKISLAQINAKFPAGTLQAFLADPAQHYRWIRMPNFKLSLTESAQLTAFLRQAADENETSAKPTVSDEATRARGEFLVKALGCLNCHASPLQNQYPVMPLSGIPVTELISGCLADGIDPESPAPRFSFTADERAALRQFLGTDRGALGRHVPSEFAERQMRLLNCNSCHGKAETFPRLDVVGGKLKPEWMQSFIGGELSVKPRPWLEARMPAFAAYASALGEGLATVSGFAAHTPPGPPVDHAAAEIGRKLIGKEGGFSCVSCHAVRSMKAMEVFESEGINLAYSAARLQYPYFRRWLLDPLLVDPQTKMPDYFEGWSSPFTEIYDGDARRQIDAIWHYLQLGDKMPLPIPNERQ